MLDVLAAKGKVIMSIALRRLLKYWSGSRVEAEGRMARSGVRRIPVPHLRDNERATQPAALLPRALKGCVDFGAGLRCSLGSRACGTADIGTAFAPWPIPQTRDDPLQYFNSLLGKRRSDGPTENVYGKNDTFCHDLHPRCRASIAKVHR